MTCDFNVVLVVDDEMFARLFAVQILLDEGFVVLEAANAQEGFELLDRNDDVGILFSDLCMPGELDGLNLLTRAAAERPDMRLVAASGAVAPAGGLLPVGATFLPKPYTAFALMAAIRGQPAVQTIWTPA